MSRYFSETIIVKIARMLNPATPTIMNNSRFRMPRSTSIAAKSGPWWSSHVPTRMPLRSGNNSRSASVGLRIASVYAFSAFRYASTSGLSFCRIQKYGSTSDSP